MSARHARWCRNAGPYSPVLSCCPGDMSDDDTINWLTDQWLAAQRGWLDSDAAGRERITTLESALAQAHAEAAGTRDRLARADGVCDIVEGLSHASAVNHDADGDVIVQRAAFAELMDAFRAYDASKAGGT